MGAAVYPGIILEAGWRAPKTAGWLLISLRLVGRWLIRRLPIPFRAAAEPAYALDPPKSSSAVVLPDRGSPSAIFCIVSQVRILLRGYHFVLYG